MMEPVRFMNAYHVEELKLLFMIVTDFKFFKMSKSARFIE